MNNDIAVVLMSGGMDSTLCAAIAHSQGFKLAGLHVNYGQRTEQRELKSFQDICDFYDVQYRLITDIGYLKTIGGSSLTDFTMEVSAADLQSAQIPSSYVPFRNANLLCIAVSWAEVIGAKGVFIGAVQDDSSGYPDCRQEFFEAFEIMVDKGTKPDTKIKIYTPILHFDKEMIVQKSVELQAPLHLTWSCYKNNEKACGQCDSCALRLRGFHKSGMKDPIPYQDYE
jgi:7-cyano-7-deazaguanine synthase